MERIKKQAEADKAPGAPEWMVTFSDCMTLLLTFFVLLLSFSSFDENIFRKWKIIFANALPSVGQEVKRNQDAFLPTEQIQQSIVQFDEGSEKPTLEKGREDNNLKEETEPADFHNRKVFLISSKKVFWGEGTAISFQGHKTLSNMASFLKEIHNRVVISENGQEDEKKSENFGLPRAWAVMNYLTTKHQLDKKRFCISATSTISHEESTSGQVNQTKSNGERVLEIVLLERNIYN